MHWISLNGSSIKLNWLNLPSCIILEWVILLFMITLGVPSYALLLLFSFAKLILWSSCDNGCSSTMVSFLWSGCNDSCISNMVFFLWSGCNYSGTFNTVFILVKWLKLWFHLWHSPKQSCYLLKRKTVPI